MSKREIKETDRVYDKYKVCIKSFFSLQQTILIEKPSLKINLEFAVYLLEIFKIIISASRRIPHTAGYLRQREPSVSDAPHFPPSSGDTAC